MSYSSYILFIPLLPLLAFAVLSLFGKKYFNTSAGLIATLLLLVSTVLSLYTAYQYFLVDGKVNDVYQPVKAFQYTWLVFNEHLQIDMGVLLDPISVMMLVVITVVSLMVHVFSLWYMKGEERFATYYAFLGLFTFSMLGLVISTNIFQMYIFWELVGVSSFLLIGYYFQKPSAVAASKKAFIVTRFADLFFLIGILIVGFQSNSFNFGTIIQTLTNTQSAEFLSATSTTFFGASILTWALAFIFIGGAGKSAMFPLHIWLPDAMEGPTPVSALIHAATMVVAGVYLVARMFPVFAVNEASLHLVTWVGLISALFAAIIACTQTDIKRVLAYSTMSQIGYMMFALGVSGYGGEAGLGFTASMFHLFTHAFFKSLLFLAAGAVIHFIHSNEIKDMGGLRKHMPITNAVFFIACLAIAGVPPLSGFFSKEEILLASYNTDKIVYAVALLTSGLTAFYMFRLYFSIFWNKEAEVHDTHHGEGSMAMKFPLILLAVLTIVAGFVPFGEFVSSDGKVLETHLHILFSIAPVAAALAGIGLATYLYKKENERPAAISNSFGAFYKSAHQKFYIDEIYLFITKKIIFNLIARPAAWIDKHIVDGAMNGLAFATATVSSAIKGLQSGKVQNYALYFFGGIAVLAVIFIYIWK
ncbi:MAG: NADH-quinone oxidoreductase subunit L [Chitinophagaceae bacterium]|nr:NADH-quinone oxidoreductase subunit L [Chitinophagaceae bacterium]